MASSKSLASSGSIVKVGRSRRSTRASAAYGSFRAASASALAARGYERSQPAVEHQPLDHVAGAIRPAELAQHARAALPAADEHEVARPGAAALHRGPRARRRTAAQRPGSGRASRAPRPSACPAGGRGGPEPPRSSQLASSSSTATGRASSRSVSGSSAARICGLMPLVRDRLAARQVVVGHGEVEHAAVRELLDLLDERPCRTCACPRPSRDCGPAGRRSRSQRRSRCRRPRARRPARPRRSRRPRRRASAPARWRPRTETISPSSMKMLDTSTRLAAAGRRRCRAGRARSPRLPARSSLSISPLKQAVGARAEAEQLDDADLVAVALDDAAARRPESRSARASTLTVRSASSPGREHAQRRPRVPAWPLIRLVATSLFTPAIERPSTREDEVAAADAGAGSAGEPSNTRSTFRPALVLLDVHADALEVAADRLLNCFASLGVR